MKDWSPERTDACALVVGSVRATTDQVCRLDEVAADWPAATRTSRVPAGRGVEGRKARMERCVRRVSSVGLRVKGRLAGHGGAVVVDVVP